MTGLELLSKIEYDFYEGLSFAFPNVCYFKEHKRLFRQDFKKQYKSFEVEDGGSITKEEKEFIESLSKEKVSDLFELLEVFNYDVLADKVSNFGKVVTGNLFREKDCIIIMISKKNYDLFNELKQELLDTNKEELEENRGVREDFDSLLDFLLELDSKSEVQSSSEPAELEYNLEGFDKLEKKVNSKFVDYINEEFFESTLKSNLYFECIECDEFFNYWDQEGYHDTGKCDYCNHKVECNYCGSEVDVRYRDDCGGCAAYSDAMAEYSESAEVAALGYREGNYDLYDTTDIWNSFSLRR